MREKRELCDCKRVNMELEKQAFLNACFFFKNFNEGEIVSG